MPSYCLVLAVLGALNVAANATNCWQNTVTIYYNVGPSVLQLQQREADAIMNQVLGVAKAKISACPGLTLILIKTTITTPSNNYAIVGLFGALYGNMDASQKQTAFICLGHQLIYSAVIQNPDLYTSPIGSNHWPDRASQSNPQDTTCTIALNASTSEWPTSTALFSSSSIDENVTVTVSPSSSSSLSSSTPSSSADVVIVFSTIVASSPSLLPSPSSSPSSSSTVETNSLIAVTLVSSSSTTDDFSSSTLAPTTTVYSTETPTTQLPTTLQPTTSSPFFSVLKCYKLEVNLLYNISQDQGVVISQLNRLFAVTPLNSKFQQELRSKTDCKSVKLSSALYNISRLDENYVNLRGFFTFSLKSPDTPDDDVARTLKRCLQEFQSPQFLDSLRNSSFPLNDRFSKTYAQKIIEIKEHQSCCGTIPPPCCPGNAIKKSRDICAPLSFEMSYSNQTRVTLDSKLTASCFASTEANSKIVWRRNENTVQTTGTALNQTLIIDTVKMSDAGDYTCEVRNEFQVISKSFQLQVIFTQEVEMNMKLESLTFHLDLENKTSAKYINMKHLVSVQIEAVFRKNSNKMVQIVILGFKKGSVIVDFKVLMSQVFTSPQENPPDLQSEVNSIMIDQANKGSFGNLTVGSLVLRVKPPPPSNLQIAKRRTKSITISWQHPVGQQSYQIERYILRMRKQSQQQWKTIDVGIDSTSYTYSDLDVNTKYEFQVFSRSPMGDGTPSAILLGITLTVDPIIANDGQNFTVTVGESVVLVCQGSSDPRPQTVTWLERASNNEISTNITGNGKILNSYMTIHNVTVDDSGKYPCRASHGNQKKDGAVNLIVKVPVAVNLNVTLTMINFTESLKNKSSPQYKKLEARFVSTLEEIYQNVTGFQRVEVLGFVNGSVKVRFRVIIVVKITQPIVQIKQSKAKVEATNLIIQKVKSTGGDLGNGLTVKKDSIQTDAPPNPPRNVTVDDIKDITAHLRWSKPQFAEYFFVSHYIIKLKKHGDEWQEKLTIKSVQLDCPLEDLEEDTAYFVTVYAKNQQANGLDSTKQEFRTKASETSLMWLWVFLPLGVILAIAGIVLCYRKNRRNDNYYDNNPNQLRTHSQNVQLYSYKNKAFSLSSVNNDLESLGMVSGKWWEIQRESLQLQENLGSGAFGLVQKAELRVENGVMTCAVKMLQKGASEEDQRDLYQELNIMDSIGRHDNLVNLIGACTCNGPPMIVLEFAEKGSLIDYLQNHVTTVDGERICSLAEIEKLSISLDIAKGMRHLAKVKCVHRDLAARNVLLTENARAKIADFGLSRDVYERGFYEKTSQGKLPVRWMAIEAIQQMVFTTQSDIWSYGVVLWEIETGGKLPYGALGMMELINHLKKGHRLQRPITCKEEIYDVMIHCWHSNPGRRPTFDELCNKMDALLAPYTQTN